ncbi:DNA repair exonuclease [Pseudactinotalea sp. HY160]|uniref:metallophosphoesterase family protein n=1 Tax=Pseudactinotalea sp. HY160 TaxID=2654490 RepID=UPI00128DACA9|nr:metallophosphoesterase [Pseudactinotalea sp. HY160]MPV50214.1 DNA repair exonuclease [Pseudactinotalea sp. HY160]
MRFVATADWQLGMAANFLEDDARPRFHQARLDAVRAIAAIAREHEAAFVVVGGDVFESNQLDRAIVARACEALAEFTVPVVLVPGNHDPLDAASLYDSAAFASRVPPHVRVLRDSEPVEVVPGVEVVGAPWFSKRPLTDLVAGAYGPLGPAPAGTTRVLVGHGAVSTLEPDQESAAVIDVPGLEAAIAEGRVHAAILGDRHSATEVATGIWYPGTPEVTARREVDPGHVLVVEVDESDRSVAVTRVRTGRWAFATIVADLLDEADVEELAATLAALPDKERTAAWIKASGSLSTRAKARLDQVLDEARDLFARLDHWWRHYDLAVVPEEAEFTGLGLTGFAEAAVGELVASARGDHEEAAVAQDALARLYQYTQALR